MIVLLVGSACGGTADVDREALTTPSTTGGETAPPSFVVESQENGWALRHAEMGVEVPLPEGFAPATPQEMAALDVFLTHGDGHTHDEVGAYSRDDGAALVVLRSSPIAAHVASVAAFATSMRSPEGANATVPLHIVMGFGAGADVRQRVVSRGTAADMRALFIEAGGQSHPFEIVFVGGSDDEREAVLDGIQRDPATSITTR